jgi:metal-responsive CopG/Arc/MetJ family transcriptional regulator
MKTAISIPDPVFRAADRIAKRKGISRSELYARAVAALVREDDDDVVTAELNKVYASSDSSLDASLAKLPSLILEREDW